MNRFYFFLFLIFILSFSLVVSIGVSPPKQYVDFISEGSASADYTILNYGGLVGTNIVLSAEGSPLAKYVSFSENNFVMKTNEHLITATINFPSYENLSVYGKQIIRIEASEVSAGPSSGSFAVVTAVEPWLIVNIPIPGHFAEIEKFSIPNVKEGEDSSISFSIKNSGTKPLSNTRAEIEVFDLKGGLISSMSFDGINIPVGSSKSFSKPLRSSLMDPGKYLLVLKYYFDDNLKPASLSNYFFVGTTDILLLNYTSNLVEGKINKISLTLQSLWGSDLRSIRASIIDFNNHSQALPVIDLGPFEKRVVETYIDVPLLNGSPFFLNTSRYANLSVDTFMTLKFPTDASNDVDKRIPLNFLISHPVDPVVESKSFLDSVNVLLLSFIILLLVLIVLVLFLVFKKK